MSVAVRTDLVNKSRRGVVVAAHIGYAAKGLVYLVTGALALLTGRPPVAALIWAAHNGLDRAAGFGLKYPSDFGDTHLGRQRGRRAGGIGK